MSIYTKKDVFLFEINLTQNEKIIVLLLLSSVFIGYSQNVKKSNTENIPDAKYLTFDNGDQLVYSNKNKTLKIPGEPAFKINTYFIFIDDVKIDADKFIKIETLNYKKYRYNKRDNILKLYSK